MDPTKEGNKTNKHEEESGLLGNFYLHFHRLRCRFFFFFAFGALCALPPALFYSVLNGPAHTQGKSCLLNSILFAPIKETLILCETTWLFLLLEKTILPNHIKASTWLLAIFTLAYYGYRHVQYDSVDGSFQYWWIARFLQSGLFFALMALPLRSYVAMSIPKPFMFRIDIAREMAFAAFCAFLAVALMHMTHNATLASSELWKLLFSFKS